MGAFVASISMILVSEFGDKTFFIAAIMAMRQSRGEVFLSAMTALILMTILSAAMGLTLPHLLDPKLTAAAATVLFFFFGMKLLYDAYLMDPNAMGKEEMEEVEEELEKALEPDQSLLEQGGIPKKVTGAQSIARQFRAIARRFFSPVFIQCFPERDTRILTDTGLLFLDEIEARLQAGQAVRYACYDQKTKALQYTTGRLVYPKPPSYLIEFSDGTFDAPVDEMDEQDAMPCLQRESLSCRVSLRVTPDHRMFVQMVDEESASNSGTALRAVSTPEMVNARDLLPRCDCPPLIDRPLCPHSRGHIRLTACAELGHTAMDQSQRVAVQHRLRLDDQQFLAFLEVFGYWLAHGTLRDSHGDGIDGSIVFAGVQRSDRDWLQSMLEVAGLSSENVTCDSEGTVTDVMHIMDPEWFAWFDDEFGCTDEFRKASITQVDDDCDAIASRTRSRANSLSSSRTGDSGESLCDSCSERDSSQEEERSECVQRLPSWMLMCLTPRELQRVVEGLRRADGACGSDVNAIFTSSIGFRDQLMQALLHCGFSPWSRLMHRNGALRGDCRVKEDGTLVSAAFYNGLGEEEKQSYRLVRADADVWAVCWAAPGSSSDNTACWPSLSVQNNIRRQPYNAKHDGRIWCVEVDHPDHLIFAQRAERHSDGSVTQQSTPVVVGNCCTMTFLAEWGDRSQIATIALAAAKNPVGVSIGAIVGHALCTGVAVLGGKLLASRISERTISLVGGCLFLLFAIHSVVSQEVRVY